MRLFRNLGVLGLLIALTGCSMATLQRSVEKWGQVADTTKKGMEIVSDNLEKVDSVVKMTQAKMEAMDTDGDGNLSLTEILLGAGGILGLGGGTLARRNAKSDARKAVIEARLDRIDPPSPV